MNIDQLVLAIRIAHEARVSIFIHGLQGLGKSMAAKMYAKSYYHFNDNKVPYGYVDLRLAGMESSELRGLPDKDLKTKVMTYFPPDELPSGEWINNHGETTGEVGSPKPDDADGVQWTRHRGILVLEEVNRAEDDIHQAIFQLVYDFMIGKWRLPTGWSIVATGNPTGGNFIVNHFMHEDAFKDRFVHVKIEVDDEYSKSWINYMSGLDGINEDIITHITQFCLLQPEYLAKDSQHDDLHIEPSPRSWEMVAKIEQAISKVAKEGFEQSIINRVRLDMLTGLIGQAVTSNYLEAKIEVTPGDVISGFNAVKSKIAKMARNQIQALSWGVVAHAGRIEKWSESQITNMIAFGKWILTEASRKNGDNRDLAVGYFDSLIRKEGQADSIRKLSMVNSSIQRLLYKQKMATPLWSMIEKDRELNSVLGHSHLGKLVD